MASTSPGFVSPHKNPSMQPIDVPMNRCTWFTCNPSFTNSCDARTMSELLSDPVRTALVIVTRPEELPAGETVELATTARDMLKLPLGPVIVNILSFHMFLDSENMALAIVVAVLWFLVFSQVRSAFAGLFVAKKAGLKSSSPAEALSAA